MMVFLSPQRETAAGHHRLKDQGQQKDVSKATCVMFIMLSVNKPMFCDWRMFVFPGSDPGSHGDPV